MTNQPAKKATLTLDSANSDPKFPTYQLSVGTIQPHYGPLLEVLDRAQWVCYTSHACKPQSADARPFDAAHCWLCTHNFRNCGRDQSCWTVDGCTTYRPDSLLLVIPRELTA
ncbi:hypothetical protein [Streptomyces sp. NPDC059712]|uniref:hypothetical protein n=1 Tax=Streptomyces sp. NPDC059712 TaxID=3346919 RepID=UPI0036897890